MVGVLLFFSTRPVWFVSGSRWVSEGTGSRQFPTAQAADRSFPTATVARRTTVIFFYLRDAHSLSTASYCLQWGDAIAGVVAIKGWQQVQQAPHSVSPRVTCVSPACHLRVDPVSPPCHPVSPPCRPPPPPRNDSANYCRLSVSPRVAHVSPPCRPVSPGSPRVTPCRLRVTPCRLCVTGCHRVTAWSCFSLLGAT